MDSFAANSPLHPRAASWPRQTPPPHPLRPAVLPPPVSRHRVVVRSDRFRQRRVTNDRRRDDAASDRHAARRQWTAPPSTASRPVWFTDTAGSRMIYRASPDRTTSFSQKPVRQTHKVKASNKPPTSLPVPGVVSGLGLLPPLPSTTHDALLFAYVICAGQPSDSTGCPFGRRLRHILHGGATIEVHRRCRLCDTRTRSPPCDRASSDRL